MPVESDLSSPMLTLGERVPRRGNRLSKAGAQALMRAAGWRIAGDVPDEAKMMLAGAPHTSNWDYILTLLTTFSLGVDLHYVGKKSHFDNPLMRYLGAVPLDRDSSAGFVQQMVAEFKRRDSFLLAIMPEGTRQKVRAWRSGFYHIAQGAGVPIVPVVFDYGRKLMRLGPAFWPTGEYEADLQALQAQYVGARGKYGR